MDQSVLHYLARLLHWKTKYQLQIETGMWCSAVYEIIIQEIVPFSWTAGRGKVFLLKEMWQPEHLRKCCRRTL